MTRRMTAGVAIAAMLVAVLGLLVDGVYGDHAALGSMWVYACAAFIVSGAVPAGSSLVETDTVVQLGIVLDLNRLGLPAGRGRPAGGHAAPGGLRRRAAPPGRR